MASQKGVSAGDPEWRVAVPGGSFELESESGPRCAVRAWLLGLAMAVRSNLLGLTEKIWSTGADDPRKVIHGFKVGLALSLVSVFYYTRPLYDGVGGTAMWAVMTVVVIFEFTVGGCLCKGFNRTAATLSAGVLAIGIHWIASRSGKTVEPIILSASVFLLASAATFSRFLPAIKARFDYGVTIFILTFSLVAVSGYRVDQLLNLAQQRASTISIGVSICLFVCILVCPVWAGEDLHLLIIRNMEKLADSLEGCVEDYFEKDGEVPGEEVLSRRSQSFKCVLNSKASEDSLAILASWEPAHGRFMFRHPWKQYLKVGAAMRYSAYCIETLNGCINSEIQAPEFINAHLSDVCTRLSSESSKVLKECASSIKSMKRSRSMDSLVGEMNNAVQELNCALAGLPNQAAGEKEHTVSAAACSAWLREALPLITVASLLIEISVRIEGVVDELNELARLSGFKAADGGKPERIWPADEPPPATTTSQVQLEAIKALQQV